MAGSTIFCKHYPNGGAARNERCHAGIRFLDLRSNGFPCAMHVGGNPPPQCDMAVWPSAEEVAAEEAEFQRRLMGIEQARSAIVAHLGGPWSKKNRTGGQGVIDCPACGGTACLQYSRAAYNGHIHARCTTEGCVSWME